MKSFPKCTALATRDLRRQDIDSNKFVIKSWKINSIFSWPYFLCFLHSPCVLPQNHCVHYHLLPWIALDFLFPEFLSSSSTSSAPSRPKPDALLHDIAPDFFFYYLCPSCLCHSLIQEIGFVPVLLTSMAHALHVWNGMLHFTWPPCFVC